MSNDLFCNKNDWTRFYNEWVRFSNVNRGNVRRGQAIQIVLKNLFPDKIFSFPPEIDPYYDDKKVAGAIEYLSSIWSGLGLTM